MYYIWLAILAGIGTGIIFFLTKFVSEKSNKSPQSYTLLWAIIGTLVFLPGIMYSTPSVGNEVMWKGIFFVLLAGFCFALANNNTYTAFKTVDLSAFTIIYRLNMIIALIGGVLVFQEKIGSMKLAGILFIVIGILVTFLNKKSIASMGPGWRNVVASAFFIALAAIFNKLAIENGIHPLIVCLGNYLLQIPFVFQKKLFREVKETFVLCWKEVVVCGILVFFSWFTYINSLKGEVSTVQPVFQAVQLTISVCVGVMFLKERERLLNKGIGFIFTVIGVVLLCFN